ncbi:MAG TPA: SAM-dependent methyltransferase, partial [Streptosporangiaceae bacterium]|nr:SAM-dependent methyltransferase [Streptosporangiaceae bacterium]
MSVKQNEQAGWVAFVGTGPGDEGLLTIRAAELLRQADLVIASPEQATVARRFASDQATWAEPAEGGVARQLTGSARAGQFVVRLYPGDPLLSGAAHDAAACAKAGVRFEVVPGMPEHTAVPAYAGIALSSDHAAELRVIHASEASRVAYSPVPLVIMGADAAPADLAKMLVANGWPEATPIAITWDGTTSGQQTVASSLGRLVPDLKAAGVSLANTQGQAVAVVGDCVTSRDKL